MEGFFSYLIVFIAGFLVCTMINRFLNPMAHAVNSLGERLEDKQQVEDSLRDMLYLRDKAIRELERKLDENSIEYDQPILYSTSEGRVRP